MRQEFTKEVLEVLKTKYQCIIKLYNLTNELETALNSDDKMQIVQALSERSKEIDFCMNCDAQINELLRTQKNVNEKDFLRLLKHELSDNSLKDEKDFIEIIDIANKMQAFIVKIVEKDKFISNKLMGKNSIYNK